MKTVDRQKMCSHCNGRIPIDADICPYCAAQQPESTSSVAPSSLFAPPYGPKREEPVTRSTESFKDVSKERQSANPSTIALNAAEEQEESAQGGFWAVLFLAIGTNLLTVGLLQFFFSDQGILKLEWDSSYWFAYCIFSVPLFYFGVKQANKLK